MGTSSGGKAGSGGRAGAGGKAGAGGTTGMGGVPGGGPADDRLVPAQGALLGLYYGDGTIASTETRIGRKATVHLVYYAWADDWTAGARTDLSAGRIPLINWEPSAPKLTDIVGGVYDTMLHQRAQSARALGGRLFLDWGAEMNGDWSAWSGANYGNSADTYVAAYRHIHDIFVGDGATNVVWAWCPNVTDEPSAAWNQAINYYPGDSYVDWMCVDGYNWGNTNGGGWQSFQTVFANIYPKLAGKGKPIMIAEMASTELGGNKAQWIDGILPAMRSQFPLFRALVWFDVNKETDWRINSSTASQDAFKRMANDPDFNP